jgi:hypothetical protein
VRYTIKSVPFKKENIIINKARPSHQTKERKKRMYAGCIEKQKKKERKLNAGSIIGN